MRSAIVIVLGLVACGPVPEDDVYQPDLDASVTCSTPITILAPRPELHYATDLAVIAQMPWDNVTIFALDDTDAVANPLGAPTEQTGSDQLTLTWQFSLQPSHRYTVVIGGPEDCTASVEFFTSP